MKNAVDLVLLWRMHQPDFRDYYGSDFALPRAYLHAIKDYADMAYHLERHPGIRVVINFLPILLDQLEDYSNQFATGQFRDPLLRLLARENPHEFTLEQRQFVFEACFSSSHLKMMAPYPAYKRLRELFNLLRADGKKGLAYLSGQYAADLLTWYHLAWCGESVRREHALIPQLMSKAEKFSYEDRTQLLSLLGRVIGNIIPRYRRLAESGQIEISTTPHNFPPGLQLNDFVRANKPMSDVPLSSFPHSPDARPHVAAHIQLAKKSHRERFGSEPRGMWPDDGSISSETLEALAAEGCQWAASGENVLVRSLRNTSGGIPGRTEYLYRPYRLEHGGNRLHCFFRDDHLSDLIGFEYSHWHGKDAAGHFIDQIARIGDQAKAGETPVVSVILDGDNTWEYYLCNGFSFIDELYSVLETHDQIRTVTFNGYLNQSRETAADGASMPRLERIPPESSSHWFQSGVL